MAKKSRINRIRTLYGILIGAVAVCISLFFLNIITAADPIEVVPSGHDTADYGLLITDLRSSAAMHAKPNDVALSDTGLTAHTYVSRYDALITADASGLLPTGKAAWCMGLQIFSALAAIAIVVLVAVALVSFYISVRRGKVFPAKKIKLLTWVGGLMIVVSLCMDASAWIEGSVARSLLAGTDWQPAGAVSIHITRIFFGLTLIFLAEIFNIGRDMQDEQELTI